MVNKGKCESLINSARNKSVFFVCLFLVVEQLLTLDVHAQESSNVFRGY